MYEGRHVVLRRRGGGATRVSGGGEGGAAGAAGGEGGGRGAEGAGGGSRGVAHAVCGLKVHPLLHEALEGGEVAIPRRLAKSLLRLRAQPSALSASQEQGSEARAYGEASQGSRQETRPGLGIGVGLERFAAEARVPLVYFSR